MDAALHTMHVAPTHFDHAACTGFACLSAVPSVASCLSCMQPLQHCKSVMALGGEWYTVSSLGLHSWVVARSAGPQCLPAKPLQLSTCACTACMDSRHASNGQCPSPWQHLGCLQCSRVLFTWQLCSRRAAARYRSWQTVGSRCSCIYMCWQSLCGIVQAGCSGGSVRALHVRQHSRSGRCRK